MAGPRMQLFTVLLCFGAAPPLFAEAPVAESDLRSAVDRALPLIQSSAIEFTRQRDCFACHHQAMSVRVMKLAESRGFESEPEFISSQIDWTRQFLARNQERYLEGKGQGGQVDTAGYALWTLALGQCEPDELTAAVCHYMLVHHEDQDHWTRTSTRPPTEASDFTTTFLAIQSLQAFATDEQRERVEQRLAAARKWLEATPAADTEDMVFRLRALKVVGSEPSMVAAAAQQLLAAQREDGGWAQIDSGQFMSDAYATGSALVALVECDCLDPDDPRYQRGLAWLLANQRDDGTWHVATRSKPIQVYFESGFPHGEDQFISMAATCWSVNAMLLGMKE